MKTYEITIQDVTEAAQANTAKYIPRVQSVANQAFVEGASWAVREMMKKNGGLDSPQQS